jgi:hypothetical protein
VADKDRVEKPSLAGVPAKFERADEHLEALQAEITRFFEAHPYGTFSDFNPHTGEHSLRIDLRNPLPVKWGVMLGDVLHNARSALDHLAWQLVKHGPKGLPSKEGTRRQVHFPVELTKDRFDDLPVLPYFGEDARRIIREKQPYHRGDKARLHPLAILDQLWNTDKHRVLHPSSMKTSGENPTLVIEGPPSVPGIWADYAVNVPLEHGAEIMKFRLPALIDSTYDSAWGVHVWKEPDVKMQGGFSVDIAFGERRFSPDEIKRIGMAAGAMVALLKPFLP